MSRSKELLKSLVGPHVLFGAAVAFVHAVVILEGRSVLVPAALALVAGSTALLAKRLTGNTLASACAGALVAALPETTLRLEMLGIFVRHGGDWSENLLRGDWFRDLLSATCGLLAASVRLMPSGELEGQPLLGKREGLALLLLLLGALAGPAVLAMPVLILASDLAFAPAPARTVLARTGKHFFLHAAAVVPALFFLPASPAPGLIPTGYGAAAAFALRRAIGIFAPWRWVEIARPEWIVAGWILVAGSVVVLVSRGRIRQTLVLTFAWAVVWTAAADAPRACLAAGPVMIATILGSVGASVLIAALLWRVSVAVTQPGPAPAVDETPIPSVPAIRELIRRMRTEIRPAGAAPAAPRVESTAGMRSTVESAVAGAVAATLEQIRLAFRGPHPTEPPGTPEQVLWNRLLTQGSGGPAPDEKPGAAIARWRDFHSKNVKPRLEAGADVLCVGATPWPLVAALAESARTVVLVERGPRAAQIAASDLRAVEKVMVVRHDGRSLRAIGDGTAGAVIALIEPTLELAGDVLALLRECRRVLRKGGVAGIGFADLALPAAQEALGKSSQAACFTNEEAIEALARLAGLGEVEVASGVVGATSIAWIRS